jgi:hypothetical protein
MTAAAEIGQQSDIKGRGVSRNSAVNWGVAVLIAIGAVLRIARWVHFRSLWLDEIYLAGSVIDRSLHDLLFTPLKDWQAAPAGFLVLVHGFAAVFGSGEKSLRLGSLVFGLGAMPLMWAVARRVLGGGGVLMAVACFSFLGPLIYYSNELKPYSCDVVASLAITLAALRWVENPDFNRALIAGFVGVLGIFFSFPAVFVLAGAGVWMLLRDRRAIGICAAWGAAFVVNYLVFIRPLATGVAHPHLVAYWVAQNAFMPWAPLDAVEWIFSNLVAIARNPGAMWLDYPDAALIGLIIGVVAVVKSRGGKLWLVLAPLPVALLASATRQYPFADRLALFFVPQYLLLIAAGLEWLWTNLPGKVAAIAIGGCILFPSAQRALGYLRWPPGREESLKTYQWVAGRYQPGDVVYLSHFAEPSFDYYESRADLDGANVHVQPGNIAPVDIVNDVKTLAGTPRVWVMLIHVEGGDFDAGQVTTTAFDQIGIPVPGMTRKETGATVYLYACGNGRR